VTELAEGIHDIPADEYHADPCPAPSLSNSLAQILLNHSPMHAYVSHPRLNPRQEPRDSSRFDLGSAAHAVLLEGGWDMVEEVHADDWRKKAAQEARDSIRAEGRLPVLSSTYRALQQMVPVAQMYISSNPDLEGLDTDGRPETTLIWREGPTWFRCRPDLRSQDGVVIMDYKTTTSAAPHAFERQIERMGYDVQGAFYLRGNRALGAPDDCRFIFLAQEISPPYACQAIGLAPSYVAMGDMKVQRAIQTWRACMASGKWPAYMTRTVWAEVPDWAEKRFAERGLEQYDEELAGQA
jgi:hypothetical protein